MSYDLGQRESSEVSKPLADDWLANEPQDGFTFGSGISTSEVESTSTMKPKLESRRLLNFATQPSSSVDGSTLEARLHELIEDSDRTISNPHRVTAQRGHLEALMREISVISSQVDKNVFEIRRLTGFTNEKLANLLNVATSVINKWLGGGEIDNKHYRHIASTLGVLRFSDRGSSQANANILERRSGSGVNPMELIVGEDYQSAKLLLGYGESRILASRTSSGWEHATGEYQPLIEIEDEFGNSRK